MQPYGGSQWWALSMDCVQHIWERVQREPHLVSFFRQVFIPDEHFFQTLVSNSEFAPRVSGYDLTFADWSQPAPPYPATLGAAYLESLCNSDKLFARKFDTSGDTKILDLIDERLLQPISHPSLVLGAGAAR
jgi:hypothetical protein